MNGQELALLLRERFRKEHADALKSVTDNLLSGGDGSLVKAASRAGRVRAIEDADVWLVEIVKQLQGGD